MSLYVFSILLFPMVRRAYVLRGGTYEDRDVGCSRGWPHVSHGISLCWSRGDDGRAYGREGHDVIQAYEPAQPQESAMRRP
jgi:hypothetical protein